MATTYGYGGEFSSDEDIEKQNERMVQAKFDKNSRPSLRQIEDTIEAIKVMPGEQDVSLSDEMLAGLLDYFKTQRGPIVDSTRKLYNKIALRLIRGDHQSQVAGIDSDAPKDTNGNSNNNIINNNNHNNNNSINLIHKAPQQKADAFSSDEDDDLPISNRLNLVQNDNDEKKMDVDSVTPTGPTRVTKQVDMSTTDEEEEEEDEDNESNSSGDDTSELEELNSESDVMDVTPIKAPANQQSLAVKANKEAPQSILAAPRATPRAPESSIKRQPLAQSTPKDLKDTAKKPYTRSQRVATRSATRGKASAASSAKNLSQTTANVDSFIENRRTLNKRHILLAAVSLSVAVLAFVFYYFRSSILDSTSRFQVKF